MNKKLLGIVLVFVLTGVFFVIGCGAILFLAPGTEIFGIRYIASGRSKYEETEALPTWSGETIHVKTYGVPITINYTDYYAAQVEFSQNFIGFTKSGYDKASLNVYEDDAGDIHVETKEMVKWLYALNSKDDYKLVLTLPKVYAADKNLYIESEKSSVEIIGGATYNTFHMVSSGGLTLTNGNVVANDLKYHTSKMINVGENIKAINYDLKSTGSGINIKSATVGDIIAKTKSGDIKFVSCQNLTVKTSSGNIRTYGGGLNSVSKAVNIETGSGDVSLGNVASLDADAKCNITSLSGSVSVSNMKDGTINATRGKVNIGFSRAIIINSKVGDIYVDAATSGIVVNGRNGDVTLGELGTITNAKVYTTTGKISVKNTYGTVELESKSNTVKLKNVGSEAISLKSGREMSATGLKGKVYAKANGDMTLDFVGITDDVTIETGSKADNVNVNAGATSYLDVDYKIVSTKGKVAKVYVDKDIIAENSKIDSGVHEGRHMILINTSYAKVVLKLTV